MTEKSYFWTGSSVGHASYAPYDSEEFAEVISAVTHGYNRVFEGVLYTPDDPDFSQLLVATESGMNVTVHTGKAFVDGKLYLNDADVTFDCSDVGYYLIVVRKTWATKLIRLAMKGPSIGGGLSVTQTDGTVWEIPICLIHSTGAVLNIFQDFRSFVGKYGVESKFIPAVCGYQATSFAATADGKYGVEFPDAIITRAHMSFRIPENFRRDLVIRTAFQGPASGNAYLQMKVYWGTVGETFDIHNATVAYGIHFITADQVEATVGYAFTSPEPTVGDIVHVEMYRDAGSVLDTINDTIYFLGWYIEYDGYF